MPPTPLHLPECGDQLGASRDGETDGDGRLESLRGVNADGGSSSRHTSNSVVSAIQALPLDVGTAVSPTLSTQLEADGSRCRGGPGNRKCGLEVKNNQQGIQCDLCMAWFHALCQDMSKSAYNALSRHSTTLAFICDKCKRSPPLEKLHRKTTTNVAIQTELFTDSDATTKPVGSIMGVDSSAQTSDCLLEGSDITTPLLQGSHQQILPVLVEKVNALETTLKNHTALLSEVIGSQRHYEHSETTQKQTQASYADVAKTPVAKSGPSSSAHKAEGVAPQTHSITAQSHSRDYRQALREELMELEERKKRKASLVIRGLGASSASEAVTLFGDTTQFLIGERVVLSEACRIRNDADLIRGNVHDVRLRRLILDRARELRNSRLSHVFIRRDLTFQQREELKARRLANATQGQSQGERPIRSSHDRTNNTGQGSQQNTHPSEDTVPKHVWNPQADHDKEVTEHSDSGNRQPDVGTGASSEASPATGTDTEQDAVQHDLSSVGISGHQSEEEPRGRPEARDEHHGGPAQDLPSISADQSGN